jgi:signal transduction histidine kinase
MQYGAKECHRATGLCAKLRIMTIAALWAASCTGLHSQPSAIDHAYHRATDILTRGAWLEFNRYIDSLDRVAKGDKHVRLLRDLMAARALRYKDRTTEAFWALDSLAIDTVTAPPILCFSWASERAQNFRDLELYEPGRLAARTALRIAEQMDLVEQANNARSVLAEIDLHEGRYDDALEAFQEAEVEAKARHYTKGVCNALIGQGNVRYMQERDTDALRFYQQAMECAKAGGFIHVLHSASVNAAAALSYTEGPDAAIALYRELLAAMHGEEAQGLRADVLANLASLHSDKGDHASALRDADEALRIRTVMHDSTGIADVQLFRATALWALGRRNDALTAVESCQRMARSPRSRADAAFKAAEFLRALGRFPEAMAQLDAHRALSDSLAARKLGERIARLEVQHGSALKDKTIEEQHLAIALERSQAAMNRRQRNALIGITALLVTIAALLYRTMRNRQRLAAKEKDLHDKHVDQLLAQQELKSINAMLEGQEKERERVSKELHDHVGHLLGTIKHQLGELEEQVADVKSEQTAQYKKVSVLLDNAAGELRRISHDMAAATLNRFGLEKALKDLRDTLHISGRLQVELSTFGLEQRLERSVEIATYRIVQELVSNVLKHAKATELSIGVTRAPGRLSLVVSDNGVGFDTAQQSQGIGLANVRSRAAALGASMQVDSAPGKGTTVSVECPVVE